MSPQQKQLIQEQRQSHQARLDRAKRKLEIAAIHAKAATQNEMTLRSEITKAEKAIAALPPEHFVPYKGDSDSYFPNISYDGVFNTTKGGEVAGRMHRLGMACKTKSDAIQISEYLKVMGKIANYALQANRTAVKEAEIHIICVEDNTLDVYGLEQTVLPYFHSRDDAVTVFNKYLTVQDKNVLARGLR